MKLRQVIQIAKITLSISLAYVLYKSEKIDFNYLTDFFNEGLALTLTCVVLFTSQILLISIRWKLILASISGSSLPYPKAFILTWIGQGFNSLIPGAIAGDVLKSIELKRHNKCFTTKQLMRSIIIDRIIGLITLILIIFITSILSIILIDIQEDISPVVILTIMLSGSAVIAISFILKKIVVMKTCIVISIINHFLTLLIFFILASSFTSEITNLLIITLNIVPIGLLSVVLPISPMGLGVGHITFEGLFLLYKFNNGASIFNIFFLLQLLVNLFGLFFYMFSFSRQTTSTATSKLL
jgi:glycosyltransferase 2 family protein